MGGRGTSLRRRLRSQGGLLLRRFGLLPGGMPDGLGQDDELLGTSLRHSIVVFFPDPPDSLYQIEQWYGPLRALNEKLATIVICMDSRTAARIRQDSGLEVIVVARDATLDDLLSRSDVKLFLYVNHNPQNFSALRIRSVIHVSMLHGDSDKTVSVSNQVKAYDFSFVAGQAAIDRLARYTMLFDAEARCIPIGRPQLDTDGERLAVDPPKGERPTVLYAPTWEGGQASVAYGSVDTHGEALIRSLLSCGRYRVRYRPHPLTGVRVSEYGDADARIRVLIAKANEQNPEMKHGLADRLSLTDAFNESDILICDVSAVTSDWLPTTRPLIITEPKGIGVESAGTKLLNAVPRLSAKDAPRAAEFVEKILKQNTYQLASLELTQYYLGDISPGESVKRFIGACHDLMAMRASQVDKIDDS